MEKTPFLADAPSYTELESLDTESVGQEKAYQIRGFMLMVCIKHSGEASKNNKTSARTTKGKRWCCA